VAGYTYEGKGLDAVLLKYTLEGTAMGCPVRRAWLAYMNLASPWRWILGKHYVAGACHGVVSGRCRLLKYDQAGSEWPSVQRAHGNLDQFTRLAWIAGQRDRVGYSMAAQKIM